MKKYKNVAGYYKFKILRQGTEKKLCEASVALILLLFIHWLLMLPLRVKALCCVLVLWCGFWYPCCISN